MPMCNDVNAGHSRFPFSCGFLFAFSLLCNDGMGAWKAAEPVSLKPNTDTTITLTSTASDDAKKTTGTVPRRLWLYSEGESELLVPEYVEPSGNSVPVPVFPRLQGRGTLTVYDTATGTTNSIEWSASAGSDESHPWLPHLELAGTDSLPMGYANQAVTATLTLEQGHGPMPASAHIKAVDNRGRTVNSRNYNTFDLLAGHGTFSFPAAGYYHVSVQLIDEPVTSLPQALLRDPRPIPYGKKAAELEGTAIQVDGVSTHTVVGTRVALEHVPTTATLGAEDRLTFAIMGKPSMEIQKNRWPFGIAGADLMKMSSQEQKTRGDFLLRWQRVLGSSFAPVLVQWSDIQPENGVFKWSRLNATVIAHRQRMVRPIVTFTGKAAWTEKLPTETSATLDAWTTITRRLSEQHLKRVWGLQLWDRPEETWPDPMDYRKLIEASLVGFQTRNGEMIPTPPVIVGGGQEALNGYLEAALTSETASRVGISFDFFSSDFSENPEKAGLLAALDKAVGIIRGKNAPDSHIIVSATGYPNSPVGTTSLLQANYLVRTYVLAMSRNVYKVMWNSLYDQSQLPWTEDPTQRMGLLNSQLAPKPSGVAYNVMAFIMSGATFEDVTTQGKASIYKFNIPLQNNKWPGLLYVAWTESPDQVQDIQLDMTHGGGVYALDYLGAEVQALQVAEDSANSIEGSYQIPVGFDPVFIWDAGKPGQTEQNSPETSQR